MLGKRNRHAMLVKRNRHTRCMSTWDYQTYHVQITHALEHISRIKNGIFTICDSHVCRKLIDCTPIPLYEWNSHVSRYPS